MWRALPPKPLVGQGGREAVPEWRARPPKPQVGQGGREAAPLPAPDGRRCKPPPAPSGQGERRRGVPGPATEGGTAGGPSPAFTEEAGGGRCPHCERAGRGRSAGPRGGKAKEGGEGESGEGGGRGGVGVERGGADPNPTRRGPHHGICIYKDIYIHIMLMSKTPRPGHRQGSRSPRAAGWGRDPNRATEKMGDPTRGEGEGGRWSHGTTSK